MLPPRSAEPQFWPIFGLFCEVLGSTRYPLAQSRGLVFSCFFQLMFYMFFSWDFFMWIMSVLAGRVPAEHFGEGLFSWGSQKVLIPNPWLKSNKLNHHNSGYNQWDHHNVFYLGLPFSLPPAQAFDLLWCQERLFKRRVGHNFFGGRSNFGESWGAISISAIPIPVSGAIAAQIWILGWI